MGVASKRTTCTVYMICISVEIYGASACFFTRTQYKLQRKRVPRFNLPSWVNELTHAQCLLAKISLCLASKKISINVVLNQRFKTLILPMQNEHKRILKLSVWSKKLCICCIINPHYSLCRPNNGNEDSTDEKFFCHPSILLYSVFFFM